MLGKVMNNCLHLQERHETDRDGDGVGLWYGNVTDWDEFWKEFRKDFCPAHSDVAAINKLESTMYYQKSWSVDDYLDEFVELVAEAGYMDPKTTVVKFWKGLDPQIQNTTVTMAYGCPSDTSPKDWYNTAKNVGQNHAENEAFKMAYQAPVSASTSPMLTPLHPIQQSFFKLPLPAHIHPTLGNPGPMDIDASWEKNITPLTCYRCHKSGHKALDFPKRFNIRLLTVEELEMELMNRKDALPKEILLTGMEHEIPEEEDFVQDDKWKACPHCLLVIILKYS